MSNLCISSSPELYQWWSGTLANVVRSQWELVDAYYQVGIRVLKAVRGASPVQEPECKAMKEAVMPRTTEGRRSWSTSAWSACGRVWPRRGRFMTSSIGVELDWSLLPDWARPTDPELYEGAHEG